MKDDVPIPGRIGSASRPQSPSPKKGEEGASAKEQALSLPSLTLPKGGGAIRGIDEKFSVNPTTGTASLTVPLPASPGRAGFAPQLTLSYDSGGGNSPFGLGWSLSLPSITRKTDKGLPRYWDQSESDVFILSGAEDLVPALDVQGQVIELTVKLTAGDYRVRSYRPRIEGLFARIERWTNQANGEVHWRSITKENITTIYGFSDKARISNPADAAQTFQWLVEESYDDKGNVILYEYKPEDGVNVDRTLPQERNRLVYANRYLKRVFYGNRTPRKPDTPHAQSDCLFEIVFDYGEHASTTPTPTEAKTWPVRRDPFSTYRAGFEIRTQRRCQRVLLFHHFPEFGGRDLVRSTEFKITQAGHLAQIIEITQTGWQFDAKKNQYQSKSLPPLTLSYSQPQISEEVNTIDAANLENLPAGLDGSAYQWIDLYSEGLSGVLTEQANAWFYKRNLGNGKLAPEEAIPKLAPIQTLAERPSTAALSGGFQQLMSLANDGRLNLVQFASPMSGFYELDDAGRWQRFSSFKDVPNLDWRDPNLKFIDLTGDGFPDILISEHEVFAWYPSKAKAGFGQREWVRRLDDEEKFPRLVFADATQSIYLADMSGDGLEDIARIRNGEICYWPNLGYGRFGAKVTMDGAPRFDHPDQFNQSRIRLADIDGSGTTDILYLGRDRVRFWINQSGNGFGAAQQLAAFPQTDNLSSVSVFDLMGNGTSCLVWSSPLSKDAGRQMRYVDLMSAQKPYLLQSITNNLGAETRIQYAASTKFYLEDRAAGTPWITKLPFPVHVIERVEAFDHISKTKFINTCRYRHGFYDGDEREFRGFGYVEQRDTESFSKYSGQGLFTEQPQTVNEEFHLPPVVTKTWFHTGAYFNGQKFSAQFEKEYFNGDSQAVKLPDTILPPNLNVQEEREACRALKGFILRQEIYAEDGSAKAAIPYSVSERNYTIEQCQSLDANRHAAFFAHPRETIDYHYERNAADPRISHSFTLKVDKFGNTLESASIGYGRRSPVHPEQKLTLVTFTENQVVNKPNEANWYRIGVPVETRTYEITGATKAAEIFTFAEISVAIAAATEIAYQDKPTANTTQKRLIEHVRTLYLKDDLSGALPLGEVEAHALPYESYKLAFTLDLLAKVFGNRVDNSLSANEGKYLFEDKLWWIPSGRQLFKVQQTSNPFLLPLAVQDQFGNVSTIGYDSYNLLVMQTTDPLNNQVKADNDYRMLQPAMVTDPNGNRSAASFDELGMVVATAVMGKAGAGEGDTLLDPTTKLEYELFNWKNNGQPNFVHTFAREQHGIPKTRWQESFSYSDGTEHEILKKVQAEPGLAPQRDTNGKLVYDTNGKLVWGDTGTNVRWVGTGRAIFDNKGNPIKQYEPFFDSSPAFTEEQDLVNWGVTPILRYDPLGRLIRTDNPNGTFSRVEFNPWQQTTYDENDTVLQSQWYKDRQNLPTNNQEGRAAKLAAAHADTPAVAHLDTLGRTFLTIADNGSAGKYETRVELDIEGNQRSVTDARNRKILVQDFDMLGAVLHSSSVDAGERWMLNNAAGKPIRVWNSRNHTIRTSYDALQRPTHLFVAEGSKTEVLAERSVYGEEHPSAVALNLRGALYQHYDGAGVVTNQRHDFKGNLLSSQRRLAIEYKKQVDWMPLAALTDKQAIASPPNTLLETESFTTATQYDALNRPVSLTTPDKSEIKPAYNEANLLERVEAKLRGASQTTVFVAGISYDAKGQRTQIKYGNNATTDYQYDPQTFRLTRLLTTRKGGSESLQDLSYTYDPVGNITHIQDDADIHNVIYFKNQRVEPSADYEYDAVYRLIKATGREHLGQAGGTPKMPTHDDSFWTNLQHPGDGNAMGNYTERYEYDEVGNILKMLHAAASGSWTRQYQYEAGSNRLLLTTNPSGSLTDKYEHDTHGNMVKMPHLQAMEWDFKDQLHFVDLSGGGKIFYVYDATGQRTRKVIEKNNATLIEERIYIGGFEIYRKRSNSAITLERETLHIMDDKQRIALVETRTKGNDPSPTQLIRYQHNNHLSSASLELDDQAQIISYEEYASYGSTSYQAVRNQTEIPKRFCYTGKERDEESGFHYYGARYYSTCLARWTSCDPIGIKADLNLFSYVRSNPIILLDPDGTQHKGSNIGSLTNEQITNIASQAKDLNDFREKLGFGPLSDEFLTKFMEGKGLTPLLQGFKDEEVSRSIEKNLVKNNVPAITSDQSRQQKQYYTQETRTYQELRQSSRMVEIEAMRQEYARVDPFMYGEYGLINTLGVALEVAPMILPVYGEASVIARTGTAIAKQTGKLSRLPVAKELLRVNNVFSPNKLERTAAIWNASLQGVGNTFYQYIDKQDFSKIDWVNVGGAIILRDYRMKAFINTFDLNFKHGFTGPGFGKDYNVVLKEFSTDLVFGKIKQTFAEHIDYKTGATFQVSATQMSIARNIMGVPLDLSKIVFKKSVLQGQ